MNTGCTACIMSATLYCPSWGLYIYSRHGWPGVENQLSVYPCWDYFPACPIICANLWRSSWHPYLQLCPRLILYCNLASFWKSSHGNFFPSISVGMKVGVWDGAVNKQGFMRGLKKKGAICGFSFIHENVLHCLPRIAMLCLALHGGNPLGWNSCQGSGIDWSVWSEHRLLSDQYTQGAHLSPLEYLLCPCVLYRWNVHQFHTVILLALSHLVVNRWNVKCPPVLHCHFACFVTPCCQQVKCKMSTSFTLSFCLLCHTLLSTGEM